MITTNVAATAPVTQRVRAYFAPVNRASETPVIFDPAATGSFDVDAPPSPWVDLGWVKNFKRSCGSKIEAVRSGAPSVTQMQVRSETEATVTMEFVSWSKLALALSAGTQQMNLLQTAAGATAQGSGGAAVAATPLAAGATANVLQVGSASPFTALQYVVVDVDATGLTGYVGSGVSGAYLKSAVADVDYVRRISLNVARIAAVTAGALTLETALPAGAPSSSMKVSGLVGFCDREGSSFFQEWSALFVMEGQQGDRVLLHYPRLQAMSGAAEAAFSAAGQETMRLAGAFRALPVKDTVDGETVVCFRSYLPA